MVVKRSTVKHSVKTKTDYEKKLSLKSYLLMLIVFEETPSMYVARNVIT